MRRSTWILLLVFGLLVVFAWVFQRYQANRPDTSSTATPFPTAEKLFSLTNLLVSALMIVDNQGNQVDLYRDSSTSNNWAVRDMPVDQADKVGIETAISDLLTIQIIDRLTENPPLDSIGLSTPVYTVTLTTTDGRHLVTDVGIKTPVGTGYYVRLNSGPVVIVDDITLDEVLNFVKKPPLLVTPTSEVTVTEVVTGTVIGTGTPIAPDITVTPTP
jgi:hypothetical protein